MRRIGIIGGGASGLMAAITAAKENPSAEVFILEQKDMLGKKLLATGNGRCNFTNEVMCADCFRSDDKDWPDNLIDAVLGQFGVPQTLEFFESLGLTARKKGPYYYPRCEQAASLTGVLRRALVQLGIKTYTGVFVTGICPLKKGIQIKSEQKNYSADKVILAAGGKASPALGSNGSGYTLAKAMGHTIVPVVPALVQLKVKNHPFKKAAGVRTEAKVTAVVDAVAVAHDMGELQITDYGISGIPVFQISRFLARGLYDGKEVRVELDFLPDMGRKETETFFLRRKKQLAACSAADFLETVFPSKLILALLKLADIRANTLVSTLTEKQIGKLAAVIKKTVVAVADTNGFASAQVCAGGIRTTEVHTDTLESIYVKGLYLTGELLDVDGICGGYNLQWAWATGHIAGTHAAID